MLFVVLNAGTKSQKEVAWHMGSKLNIDSTDLVDVDEVQADGNELDFIKQNCPTVRVGQSRVETVKGNDAMVVAAMILAKN